MLKTSYFIFVFISLLVNANAASVDDKALIEKFVKSFIVGEEPAKSIYPSVWKDSLESVSLDLNQVLGTNYGPGIAYGVVFYKLVKHPFNKVKAALQTPGSIPKMVCAIKTQNCVETVSQSPVDFRVKLAIHVPVLSDFKTEDLIWIYEGVQGRGVYEWKQVSDGGHLTYNHGAIVAWADGEQTKVLGIATHIIDQAHQIPWYGRAVANVFTKKHYSSYITVFESLLDSYASSSQSGTTSR